MRLADNHKGWNVEVLTPLGWVPMTPKPHVTQEIAGTYLAIYLELEPTREFRVYEAV